jgi:hypothetical protein
VPPAGTVCQPEGTPFTPATAATRDRAAFTAATIPVQVRRALAIG